MYPQRVADLTVALHAFPAHRRLVDGGDVGVRGVQPVDVTVHKPLEDFGRIGGVGDACPGVEVLLRIVQPPRKVEPDIEPEQVFRFVQQGVMPLPLKLVQKMAGTMF